MALDRWIPQPNQADVVAQAPTTRFYLCSGIPWDNTYKHVRLFANNATAYAYCYSMRVDGEMNAAPIREDQLEVNVPYNQMVAWECNYMIFQNLPYSQRWYFAFIVGVRHGSNNSSIVKLELDVFQNNFYDITLKPSFVVREHVSVADDIIGGNRVPENIETGEYRVANRASINFGEMYVCFYATGGTTGDFPGGTVLNGVYVGALLARYPVSDVDSINAFIKGYSDAGRTESLIACFMAPSLCVNRATSTVTVNYPQVIEGYTPRNKKLYQSPYMYVSLDNNSGTSADFMFELSNTKTSITFESEGVIATSPAVYTVPKDYNFLITYNAGAVENSSFPIVAFSNDAFQAWIAQNKNTIALSALGATATAVVGGATGNIAALAGGASAIAGIVAKASDKARLPKQVNGKVMSENINTALGLNRIDLYTYTVTGDMARVIDDYFTCFGYQTNRVKVPNTNSRSTWNYVETRNIGFGGGVSMDDLARLRRIFDDGVTLWHTNDIGNYGLENN